MNRIHHICIQTSNYKESLEFYTEVLGFEVVKETKDFHTRDYNTWLDLEGFMIELQTPKKDTDFAKYNKESEGIVHFCLLTENLMEEYERLKKLKVNFKVKGGKEVYKV